MRRARSFAPILLLAVVACAAGAGPGDDRAGSTIHAVVERVVDGDTAWFTLDDGTSEKVRFIGVDTPESTNEHEPFGKEAAAYTTGVLTVGRAVELATDVDRRDRYGRLLAYVWFAPPANGGEAEAREQMLNAMLVRDGWATVLTVPPNVAYVDLFVALQLEARVAQRGLWAGLS
ncbi:MAG: thermonuclease family protein [Actinomycetota bacterium]